MCQVSCCHLLTSLEKKGDGGDDAALLVAVHPVSPLGFLYSPWPGQTHGDREQSFCPWPLPPGRGKQCSPMWAWSILGDLAANAASGSFLLTFSRVVERYLVAALFPASGKIGKVYDLATVCVEESQEAGGSIRNFQAFLGHWCVIIHLLDMESKICGAMAFASTHHACVGAAQTVTQAPVSALLPTGAKWGCRYRVMELAPSSGAVNFPPEIGIFCHQICGHGLQWLWKKRLALWTCRPVEFTTTSWPALFLLVELACVGLYAGSLVFRSRTVALPLVSRIEWWHYCHPVCYTPQVSCGAVTTPPRGTSCCWSGITS